MRKSSFLKVIRLVTLFKHFAQGRLGLAVKEGRIEKVSAVIEAALVAGRMSFADRSSLVGKLKFTIIPAYGQVGRACPWALRFGVALT